jgi:apolipoprotein D and lipocalin family protein
MKIYLMATALTAFAAVITGCLSRPDHPLLSTVAHVDLASYTGRLDEIARNLHHFEKGCSSVTADYTLQADGSILVVNQCRLAEKDGKIKRAEGRAKVMAPTTNANFKVSFFCPFYGDFWILKLDERYQFANVGE